MKRTFERILFMIIGLVIALFAYMFGNIDKGADAEEFIDPNFGEVIGCDTLIVNETFLVGNPERGHALIKANGDEINITARNRKHSDNFLSISVSDSDVSLELVDFTTGHLYCHRKFRPLSKPRLLKCYNTNLLERSLRWRNEEGLLPSLKRKLCLRLSAVKVPRQKCGVPRHNLSEQQLSKWKQQVVENVATLFVSSTDQQSSESAERIAHLEQLVGRLTVALDIEKKALTFLS